MKRLNNGGSLRLPAMLVISLLILTGCVKKPAVVLQGDSQILELQAGQPAPSDGFILSPAALSDLMECCNDRLAQ